MNFNWDKYKTDKNDSGHSYCRAYDKFLLKNSSNYKKVLEIGVRKGSIELWLSYFPNAKIYGIDIKDPSYTNERFTFEVVDQLSEKSLTNFFEKHGYDFDVIIDDGPHISPAQIKTFNIAFPKMKNDSFYIVEDLDEKDDDNIKNYFGEKMDSEHTFLELSKLIYEKNEKIHQNKYLTNSKEIINSVKFMEIESGDKIKWSHHKIPSKIAFFIKG